MAAPNVFSGPVEFAAAALPVVTQITNRTTGVTVVNQSGIIVTDTTALGTGTSAGFVVTCPGVTATSNVLVSLIGSTPAPSAVSCAVVTVTTIAAGVFTIRVSSVGSGDMASALRIYYSVLSN